MSGFKKSEMELLRQFAHEVGNPLNTMLGYANLIKGESGKKLSSTEIKDYADRIGKATRRLAQVCERVLDESIQGHSITRKEPLDFNEFCIEIIETFEFDAKERGVNLDYEIATDFPIMQTDPVLLYEIMSNLIANGIKFTPKGGHVTVKGEVNRKNEALILVVRDTGKGMPTTIINSLMKGGQVTTSFAHTNRKGWGVGMQTVMEKAQLLGGELEIERAMNGGTVMCVRLPMDESVAA
ncbi:MAG: HAMP domain-containing histidine kinase [Magnetovibrio sp.]|nr:HAMP domain-containing histidine kinase [Magnetovibrio sp.]